MLASHPATTLNYPNCQAPISTGNVGKWLSEIIFGWKHYNKSWREEIPNLIWAGFQNFVHATRKQARNRSQTFIVDTIQCVQKTPTTLVFVQDSKLIIFQDGTPVRNCTVWALQSMKVPVPSVVNKPNMYSASSSVHYKRNSNCVAPTSLQRLLHRPCWTTHTIQ